MRELEAGQRNLLCDWFVFGFFWLVPSWKWGHSTGNLAVINQVLGRLLQRCSLAPRLLATEAVGLSSIVICGLATVCLYIQSLSLLNFLVHFPLIVPALCAYNSKMLAQSKYLILGDYWWLFDLHHPIPNLELTIQNSWHQFQVERGVRMQILWALKQAGSWFSKFQSQTLWGVSNTGQLKSNDDKNQLYGNRK